jgi:hypothetical protein
MSVHGKISGLARHAGGIIPRMRLQVKLVLALSVLMLAVPCYAGKIKTFWSGSGMTAKGPQMIMLQLSPDGTAVFQQTQGENTVKLHAQWRKDGNIVSVRFDSVPGQPPKPTVAFELKKNQLIPQIPGNAQMGNFAYPTLTPFGPETVNAGAGSTTCANGMPGTCVNRETWSSNGPQ